MLVKQPAIIIEEVNDPVDLHKAQAIVAHPNDNDRFTRLIPQDKMARI